MEDYPHRQSEKQKRYENLYRAAFMTARYWEDKLEVVEKAKYVFQGDPVTEAFYSAKVAWLKAKIAELRSSGQRYYYKWMREELGRINGMHLSAKNRHYALPPSSPPPAP